MAMQGLGVPVACACMLALFMSACERPPARAQQGGFRGTGIIQVDNPRVAETQRPLHTPPEPAPPTRMRANAPTAGATYANVKVLGDLSIAEFARTMDAITAWVAPAQSCIYCHVEGNFADDGKYTKVIARRMLQMVRHLNQDWQPHVGNTGVTCYTCHRGQPLPAQVWFRPAPSTETPGTGLVRAAAGTGLHLAILEHGSLPADALSWYLQAEAQVSPVRVAGTTALAGGKRASIGQTEHTYALMLHISKSLGVNCTFCHNTRSFGSWAESTPQRTTAWHGLRMVRDVNANYLDPLSSTFPEIPLGRLGPSKDAAKVHCATCHRGVNKPLYGAPLASHYPGLLPPALASASAASAGTQAATANLPRP